MTEELNEAQAVEALASDRDRCAQSVLEFMAACGVRTTTMPPQLLELLTLYGLKAIDIGHELAHKKRTWPETAGTVTAAASSSGIAPALRGGAISSSGIAPALRGGAMSSARAERSESGLLPTAQGSERRRKRSAEITRKVVLASQR